MIKIVKKDKLNTNERFFNIEMACINIVKNDSFKNLTFKYLRL